MTSRAKSVASLHNTESIGSSMRPQNSRSLDTAQVVIVLTMPENSGSTTAQKSHHSCPELAVMQASIFRLLKIALRRGWWSSSSWSWNSSWSRCFTGSNASRCMPSRKNVTYGTKGPTPKTSGSLRCPVFEAPRPYRRKLRKIADGDEVIGVVVNGKARAYWLKALKYPPWHIVNDVVVGVPVR